jgi:hypothetical protein
MKSFHALPHFTGAAWQGGPTWPDAGLGWVQLTAAGGHAGNDLQHAAVRRWKAPKSMTVAVHSEAIHDAAAGDGIRCRIVSSRSGTLAEATLHHAERSFDLAAFNVEAGETIDFVVDFHANLNNDQFLWTPKIVTAFTEEQPAADDPASDDPAKTTGWNAKTDFAGPRAVMLKPWEQLAQVLLISNELMFAD